MFLIVLIPVLGILFFILVICFYFSNLVVKPKVWKYEDSYNNEVAKGRLSVNKFNDLPKEEVYIKSPYNYKIHAVFFPNENSKKTIIFCHGFTYSLFGSVKYMDMFLKRGFNVLIYDHRFHGKSEGIFTTGGYYEKYDLKTCTDWVLERVGYFSKIGIHGESMGAATALQNAAIDERISFYIADCPYSDYYDLLKFRLKADYHLPAFPFLLVADWITEFRTGMDFRSASPIKTIDRIETPVFFIHGEKDIFIPNYMSVDMYNKKPGKKKLYIAPNAEHAASFVENREEYEKLVDEFLNEIGMA